MVSRVKSPHIEVTAVCTTHPLRVYHSEGPMSKQIHDEGRRESSRRTQVKFRADETLLEQFDEYADENHESRSEALRYAMRRCLGAADDERAPLYPPAEDPLRTAYLSLVEIANADGNIRHDYAVRELSSALGKPETVINHAVLGKLRHRGYLRQVANVYGERHWSLRGWDA